MEKHLKKALLFVVLSITISTMYFSRSLLLKPFISHHNTPIESEINSIIANASVPFIKNEGQTDKEVSFYASTLCGTAFVTRKSEIVYSLEEIKENETNEYKTIALKETLVNANAPFVHGEDLSETKVNIFLGDDSSKWKKNISTYNTVSLGELYEGIEVKLKAYSNNIEKLFYISSKGNVKDIKIKISGADTLTLGRGGELTANTSLGAVAFTKPIAYQEINGKRTYVEVKYTINNDSYAFDVGSYDKTIPLVIDPLLASTFVGGSDSDYGYDVVLDASNNVYIAGHTNSFSYPTTTGVYQTAKSGGYDVFVSKFNNDLSALSASTFIGGSGSDKAYAIALDSSYNVYIAGCTNSTNYPINNAYQAINNGNYDAFISKLSNDLSTLLSSTYVGSSSYDYAYGIALDSLDSVYITGYTNSINYPTTVDAYQTVNSGGYDAFVNKFNSDLSALAASTFIGGSGSDNAFKIALNSSGNLYITGYTDSSDYPITANAYQNERKGLTDVFVSQLTNDLKVLSSSTYVGGSNYDKAYAFAFDSSNNVYITGETYSSDYPTTIGVYQSVNNGGYDAFVSKISDDLSTLLASTFVGGSSHDYAYGIALNSENSVYITGKTLSADYPTTNMAYEIEFNGNSDVFVSKFNNGLSALSASTFIGGSSDEEARAIAIDSSDNIYATGFTNSSDYPITSGAYQINNRGACDTFVCKFNSDLAADTYTINATAGSSGTIVPSGSITVNYGSDQIFTITPDTGYHILDVLVDNVSVGSVSTYTFKSVKADHTISATFEIDTHTLNVTVFGNGSVVKDPDQINYNYGTIVTLTATPDTGWHFVGWSGDATGSDNPLTVTMNTNKNITALFEIDTHTLNVTVFGNGSVTKNPDQINYNYGTIVTLTATPDTGWHFVGWSGDATGSDNPLTVTMNVDKNITSLFGINTYIVTATVSGTNGAVLPLVQTVNYGNTVSVVITPDAGYHITSVTDNGTDVTNSVVDNGDGTYTYTIAAVIENRDVVVTFAIDTYTITASAGSNGSISPSGDIVINYGDNQIFTITPDTGYHILDVTADGSSQSVITTYTFNNITANHTISATFEIDTHTLNVTVFGNGSVVKDPDQINYNYGTIVTLTATPDTGWHFVGWSGDATGSNNPLTITMNVDKNITSLFEINTYIVTATVSGTNGAVLPLVQTVNYGNTVSVVITPDAGYHITSVTDNGTDVTNSVVDNGDGTYTYTIAAVIENRDVVVTFAIDTYTINATADSNGLISPSGNIIVNYGSDQIFTITADTGYMINQVIVDGSSIKPLSKTYTFTNVTSDHTISVTFTKIPDTTPPTLTLSGVDLNVSTITSSSFFSFDLIATDNSGSITRTVVKNNGITIKNIKGLPIGNDPTITLFEGINDIEVIVYDTSGNFTTKSFRVISDTKPPVVKLNNIPESVSSNALNITGTAFDTGTGVKEVKINGKTVALSLSGKLNITYTLTQGKNIITIQATDKAGNTMTETYTVNYIVPTPATIITLQINNPGITINGITKTIDAQGSKPIIENDRTLLPIRVLIESLGGHITWNGETREVTINLNYHTIILTIDNNTAVVDGINIQIDPKNSKVTPIIINGRTYLPLRFIMEHLNANIDWNNETRTVTMYYWP